MQPAVTFDNLSHFGDRVYLCEVNDGLSLYHYKTCTETDDPLLQQVRGIIFDKDKNLVMRGFPFTPEYILDDPRLSINRELIEDEMFINLNEKLGGDKMNEYRFFPSFEGTVIRVFNFNNKWYVSTHKRIDASQSYWSSDESFETLFRNAIDYIGRSGLKKDLPYKDYETFFTTLDKDKQYMFLLRATPETRIVSMADKQPTVFHAGTFVNHQFTLEDKIPGILFVPEIKFKTFLQMYTFVLKANPMHFQGIIAMSPTRGFYKLTNPMYAELYKIRGNTANLNLRYLQLRSDDPVKLNSFLALYSDHSQTFSAIEKALLNIAKNIHNIYIRRFIRKEFAVVPPEQYNTLKKCHGEYIANKKPIYLETVLQILNKEPAEVLIKMLNS